MKHKLASNKGNKLNKIFVAAFFSSAMFFSATPVFAQSDSVLQTSPEVLALPEIEVEYLGNIDQHPVYVIKVNNIEKTYRWLSITNEQGDVLHSENLKEEYFLKKFKIDMPDANDTKLLLTVWGNKNSQKEVFLITSSLHTSQKVAITKR